MSLYDATNCISIELELKGFENKNKEINSFINYIKQNNVDDTNLIFVLDRSYFSYDLINFLIDKKIKFVIRVKNNWKKYLNNDKEINKIKNDEIRFIK